MRTWRPERGGRVDDRGRGRQGGEKKITRGGRDLGRGTNNKDEIRSVSMGGGWKEAETSEGKKEGLKLKNCKGVREKKCC